MPISFTVHGPIEFIGPVESTAYGEKCQIVVGHDIGDRYEQYYQLSLSSRNAIEAALNAGVGAIIYARCELKGRKYEKKDGSGTGYFTLVECWKIDTAAETTTTESVEEVPF